MMMMTMMMRMMIMMMKQYLYTSLLPPPQPLKGADSVETVVGGRPDRQQLTADMEHFLMFG